MLPHENKALGFVVEYKSRDGRHRIACGDSAMVSLTPPMPRVVLDSSERVAEWGLNGLATVTDVPGGGGGGEVGPLNGGMGGEGCESWRRVADGGLSVDSCAYQRSAGLSGRRCFGRIYRK